MSYFPDTIVSFKDSHQLDGFGRLRTSTPITLLDSTLQYGKLPIVWGEAVVGAATSTHIANESVVDMTCSTTNGDSVVRQTHKYYRYQPGKSQLIMLSAVLGAAKTNCRKRVGYFDPNNGVFFEQIGASLAVVRRSSTTGSPVDVQVAQSGWNLDKMDGTGSSGLNLDPTKSQIFVVDLEWLGVGRVRMGVVHDGRTIYCHEFQNDNALTTTYMTTANLPVRYEIVNTGATASPTTLKQICTAILTEGGTLIGSGPQFSVLSGAKKPITSEQAILTIRPKASFNSITNRGLIIPDRVALMVATKDIQFRVLQNATLGGTPSWASVGANSITEYDTAATTVSGGEPVFTGMLSSPSGSSSNSRLDRISAQDIGPTISTLALSLNFDATGQDTLTVTATSQSGTANVSAGLSWVEWY